MDVQVELYIDLHTTDEIQQTVSYWPDTDIQNTKKNGQPEQTKKHRPGLGTFRKIHPNWRFGARQFRLLIKIATVYLEKGWMRNIKNSNPAGP